MAPVPPLPSSDPLAVFPRFIARQNESIVLQERVMSLSGHSFSIKTTTGRPLMQVKGKAFSARDRKMITDAQGNHLLSLRKKAFNVGPTTYYGEDPQGKKIFVLKGKIRIFGSKDIGTFENVATRQPVSLLMKGNLFANRADIKNLSNGQPVARIHRKSFIAGQILADRQTYVVTCARGVDMAIIVAMCICLDERRSERQGNTY